VKKTLAALILATVAQAADNKLITGDPSLTARNVSYHVGSATQIYTQRRWLTLLKLNKDEKIINVMWADKDNFEVHSEKNSNFITINTKADSTVGSRTNLSLLTASGNLYTIALFDVTGKPEGHADIEVNLDASADAEMTAAIQAPPKFVPAGQLEALGEALRASQAETQAAKAAAAAQKLEMEKKLVEQTDEVHTAAVKEIHSGYRFTKAKEKPFEITSMTDDGRFTYFKTNAAEQFAVYQMKDGKPVAINLFNDGHGSVRLDRVVDAGYFQIGKKKVAFAREKE
jgi:type IV secretory pathway VirB9-like protein